MSPAFLNHLGTDALELIKYSVFIPLFLLSTVGVILGVYLENHKFTPAIQSKGWTLLLWSLALETAFSVLIFSIDWEVSSKERSIIRSQQSTISQLETPRRLSPLQKERIAAAIKTSPKIPFLAMTVPDAESWDFVLDISATLKEDGWNWQSFPGGIAPIDGRPAEGMTIMVGVQIDAPPRLMGVARALAAAIENPSIIGMDKVVVEENESIATMIIMVGSKR